MSNFIRMEFSVSAVSVRKPTLAEWISHFLFFPSFYQVFKFLLFNGNLTLFSELVIFDINCLFFETAEIEWI